MNLSVTLADLEKYLSEKDEDVKKEVKTMGDKDYIPWSERVRNEGRVHEIFDSIMEGDYGISRGAEKLGVSEPEFVKMMEDARYKLPVSGRM